MTEAPRRDWLAEFAGHEHTCICERGLRAAAGIAWQQFGAIASGRVSEFGRDHYDPARSVVAEYLRHTGRMEEAIEVDAIGCHEPPPRTGFGRLDGEDLARLRSAMRGN